MPTAPKTLRRAKEGTKRAKDTRPSAHKRGYDRAWRKFREQYFELNPLCADCYPQRVTPANELHHIKKVRDRPDLRLSFDNVMGLCKACHSKRTARGE